MKCVAYAWRTRGGGFREIPSLAENARNLLPEDQPTGYASASTGETEVTPMNEEMVSLFEEIELQDMIDVHEQSAAGSATVTGGGGAPR
eukprot:5388194-Prymnesium_polylepis.1